LIEKIIHFQYPLTNLEKKLFLWENILYFYREYERKWISYPQPLRYNDRLRFWFYTLGFHYNFKKLSYWSLPKILHQLGVLQFGTKGKILILISKDISSLKEEFLKQSTKSFSISYNNSNIVQIRKESKENLQSAINQGSIFIESLNKNVLKPNNLSNLLKLFKKGYSLQNGYVSHVIWCSGIFLTRSIKWFINSHKKKKIPLSYLSKWITQLKKSKNILIEPEPPLWTNFKDQWALITLRKLGFIITDQNEY
jgi:hypothetical protein